MYSQVLNRAHHLSSGANEDPPTGATTRAPTVRIKPIDAIQSKMVAAMQHQVNSGVTFHDIF